MVLELDSDILRSQMRSGLGRVRPPMVIHIASLTNPRVICDDSRVRLESTCSRFLRAALPGRIRYLASHNVTSSKLPYVLGLEILTEGF
jgi:hypothetical protein